MTSFDRPESESPDEAPQGRLRGWITGILVAESIALGIALVSPVTPSKTGSTWSPAHIFSPDPTYPEKVFASFVVVNILLLGLGAVAWVVSKLDRT